MRPQLPPLALDTTTPEPELELETTTPEPELEAAPPANRAARRKAKAGKQVAAGADRNRGGAGSSQPVHSRSAQGRRINPVRRTG